MDSSSSSSPHSHSPNWLAFSLSNPLSSSSASSHFPLFPLTGSSTAVGASPEAKDAVVGGGGPTQSTGLSMLTCGPKFEDFLGGGGGGAAAVSAAPPQFSTADSTLSTVVENEMYDSELKTIAASFLRGFAASGGQAEPQQKQALAPSEPSPKKSVDTFGQRTSIYRGVTRWGFDSHRWTGRYEAHLWDNSCRREGQSRKGRQGGYDKEDKAARAYDLAALKYWGPTTTTNFPISNYQKELEEMKNMTRQEFVASLRRKSSGFSRGASIYRGVTRHHQHGRWQARIGRVAGNKDLYLGTFSTQEEAAEAYDIAAIKFRGLNAVTNFDMSRYDVKSIANSSLPIGGLSGKNKTSVDSPPSDHSKSLEGARSDDRDLSSVNSSVTFASQPTPPLPSSLPSSSSSLSFAIPIKQDTSDHHYWSLLAGYNNKNPSFQSPSSLPFSVDFSTQPSSASNESNHNNNNSSSSINNAAFFNGGGGIFVHQQQNASVGGGGGGVSSGLIPLTTSTAPIALNSNSGFESTSGYGNWSIGPTLHTFQTHAKPSLFQTPIFGME
ncbi:AP2-like ethylene-responsive transcription factor AIL5 [Senna tora]|uniref:AP2-like ethylene-responsive transcription factor AIL5 n=1 Tax=Senna tora TaxID=362788 RepID=A0A834SLM0_9FABA|nr:AP2-like ethylene-responsive transcription factor AIL5 [Senna tora]